MNYTVEEKEAFMREALREAEIALEHDEIPIGCVIVKDGEIIGLRGFDSIILAFGTRPEHTLAEELEGMDAEVVTVGDAAKAGNAVEAIYRGAVLGTTI